VKDETGVPELKGKEDQPLKEKENQHPPIFQGFSTASGKSVSVSAKALNRVKLLFTEEDSRTDIVEDEKGVPELKEKKEPHSVGLLVSSASSGNGVPILALNRANFVIPDKETGITELKGREDHGPSVLQGSSPVSGNSVCISTTGLNRAGVFISEVEATCMEGDCHEGDGPESSLRLKAVSVSKDKPKKAKLKLSRKVSNQKESDVSFKVPQSEQITCFRTFFLNESQRDMQDCKQNTCISEEACPETETLNRFVNTSDVKRNSQHRSCIQVHGYSTDMTATEVVNNNERDNLWVATSPSDCVTEEYSKREKESMSLTQEVKESAAALLADEAVFNSPSWIVNYISCPDILYDRDTAPSALVCSEVKDGSFVTTVEPGSPVLGSQDRCRNRQRVRMADADDLGYSSHTPTHSSFKVSHLHVMIHSFIFFCSIE
jgi:hypothetical protein